MMEVTALMETRDFPFRMNSWHIKSGAMSFWRFSFSFVSAFLGDAAKEEGIDATYS
jgi:hypothetical protein